MGWRTWSALLAFWIAAAFHPLLMAGVAAAGIALLLLLYARDYLRATAERMREAGESTRATPLLGGDSALRHGDE